MLNTNGQYMKESNILVGNATIKQHPKEIWINTKYEYMRKSKFPCGQCNHQATSKGNIDQHQEGILMNTRGPYMKESIFLAGNATTKLGLA